MNNKAICSSRRAPSAPELALPATLFKVFGVIVASLGVGIILCNEAAYDSSEADSILSIFDVTTPAGFLTFIAGFLAAVTGCKKKRALIIATLVLCGIAIVTDIKILASSARTVAAIERASAAEQQDSGQGFFHDHQSSPESSHVPLVALLHRASDAAPQGAAHEATHELQDEASHEASHEASDEEPHEAAHEMSSEASYEASNETFPEAFHEVLNETSHESLQEPSHDPMEHAPHQDPSSDTNAKKYAKHTALIVLTVLSFVFLLAISILGGKELAKETDADRLAMYGTGADRTPLIQTHGL